VTSKVSVLVSGTVTSKVSVLVSGAVTSKVSVLVSGTVTSKVSVLVSGAVTSMVSALVSSTVTSKVSVLVSGTVTSKVSVFWNVTVLGVHKFSKNYETSSILVTTYIDRYLTTCGPGSSVGLASFYGLDSPEIESQWGTRFSAPVQTGPPSFLDNGYRVFPGGKERPGCDADPSPPSSALVKNE